MNYHLLLQISATIFQAFTNVFTFFVILCIFGSHQMKYSQITFGEETALLRSYDSDNFSTMGRFNTTKRTLPLEIGRY